MPAGSKLMFYDKTCTGSWIPIGLSHSWCLGGHLYRHLKRLDDWQGVGSWHDALHWLLQHPNSIAEIQYWGHGKWGRVYIGDEYVDRLALISGHKLYPLFKKLRKKFQSQPDEMTLWWFRTCETFGALAGHEFSQSWSEFFRCRVAGHTHIIGPLQSGLQTLAYGQTPQWSSREGLKIGTPMHPVLAKSSGWREPNTITCLHGTIPARLLSDFPGLEHTPTDPRSPQSQSSLELMPNGEGFGGDGFDGKG